MSYAVPAHRGKACRPGSDCTHTCYAHYYAAQPYFVASTVAVMCKSVGKPVVVLEEFRVRVFAERILECVHTVTLWAAIPAYQSLYFVPCDDLHLPR